MAEYISNPNQREITTHKQPTDNKDKDNYYAKINLNALQKAMSSLTPKAFELWIYLSKNVDSHKFWLSKVDFLSWANVGETSYYNAFNELVKLGFLVQRQGTTNRYDFYEKPIEKEIEITIHKN